MIRQAVTILGLFAISFVIAAEFELFESLYELTREYEAYQLDEFFSLAILFSGFMLIYSIYTNVYLFQAIWLRKAAEQNLSDLNRELEKRVIKRTAQLNAVNVQLRNEMDERAKMNALLAQNQKLETVGTMAGGICHDFNTLLGIIMGYAGMINTASEKAAPAHTMSEEILDAARRSKKLINQLSSFANPEKSDKKVQSLQSVIQDGARLLNAALPPTVSLSQDLPDTPCPMLVDADQIIQVILNLGINASHALEEDGRIQISLEPDEVDLPTAQAKGVESGAYFKMTVSDTGLGIAPEILNNIFDPFFTTKEVGQGSGLGLSVVFGIIKSHNGFVDVDSTPDQGSRFMVLLPQADIQSQTHQDQGGPHGQDTSH
ncbi:MAG: hypothetical protein JEZ12_14300 [Desulfobacterium sp.]|nr:hypothetical protein [Desulfobacterium sp.]